MKITIILVLLISTVLSQINEQNRPAQTFSDGKSEPAVNYSLGSNGGYTLKNENNYKTPQMITKLQPRKSPYDGTPNAQGAADEIPSITNYYDGTERLNSVQVRCKVYANVNDCVHQAGCGWCGSTSSCIMGNQIGPMETCAASTYVFTSGAAHPEERVVKENVGSLAMTILQN